MALFANNWINVDLRHAAHGVIIKQNVGKIIEQPLVLERRPINKQLRSAYFRDMITLEKHSKASYHKDEVTGKHKKSSYVKEFVTDK